MKDSKLKVQASIQGDTVRVTGKNRDDLQEAIAFTKNRSRTFHCNIRTSATDPRSTW